MSRSLDRVKRFYQPELDPGEEIKAIRNATAAGTGSKVGYGAVIGALVGWLYAINTDSSLLPALVLGALAGELGGYLLAHRSARSKDGPGTIHLQVVLTDRRLFTVRRHASIRRRILRNYPLDQIKAAHSHRYPIARFHRLTIELADERQITFILEQPLDLPLNSDPASG